LKILLNKNGARHETIVLCLAPLESEQVYLVH
jgi:hypothetical protein